MLTVAVGLQFAIESVQKENVRFFLSQIARDVIAEAIAASLQPGTLWHIPGPSVQDIYRLLWPVGFIDMGPFIRYYFPQEKTESLINNRTKLRSCLIQPDDVRIRTTSDPTRGVEGMDDCEYIDYAKGVYKGHKVFVKRFKNCREEVISAEVAILTHLAPYGVTPQFVGVLPAGPSTFYSPAIVIRRNQWLPLEQYLQASYIIQNKILRVQIAYAVVNIVYRVHQQKIILNDFRVSQLGLTAHQHRGFSEQMFTAAFMDLSAATRNRGQRVLIPAGKPGLFDHVAPEVKSGGRATYASDIYSLGKILRFITRAGPMPELDRAIEWCCRINPKDRPTAKELFLLVGSVYEKVGCVYHDPIAVRRPNMKKIRGVTKTSPPCVHHV